jgi:hypothetical protein
LSRRPKVNRRRRPGRGGSSMVALSAPIFRNPAQLATAVVSKFTSFVSTAGGFIDNIVDLNPSGYNGWTDYSGMFDEWRLIGGEIALTPSLFHPSSIFNGMLVTVFDNDDASTALTATGQALSYATKLICPAIWSSEAVKRLRFHKYSSVGVGGAGTSLWATTANSALNPCSIKAYATALSNSTSYVHVAVRLVLEFRGRSA